MAAENATDLIAGAMGSGYSGLSARDCLMALLALYAGGLSVQEMVSGAASNGYSALSDSQLKQTLLYALQP